jgi:hypothetical protein
MSEEQEQLPDWLLSMRGQSLDESLGPQQDVQLPPEEPPQEGGGRPLGEPLAEPSARPLVGPLVEEAEVVQEQTEQPDSDMVDFLRDMVQPDEGFDDYGYGEERVSGVIPGMKPWQSLVLAILFLLDVAVCGCMALAMLGRIGF